MRGRRRPEREDGRDAVVPAHAGVSRGQAAHTVGSQRREQVVLDDVGVSLQGPPASLVTIGAWFPLVGA